MIKDRKQHYRMTQSRRWRASVGRVCAVLLLLCSGWAQAATVLIVGDSLSAAYGIQPEQGWVKLLDKQLPKAQLINASISGETTGGGLARLPALLKQHQPQIVVIELGGNDGIRGYPLKKVRQNLDQMISQSKTSGADVLLVGMRIPPNYGPRYTKAFYQLFGDLAEQHRLPYIPFFLENIALKDELMQADGIHPTAEAQPKMAVRVKMVLGPMLGK